MKLQSYPPLDGRCTKALVGTLLIPDGVKDLQLVGHNHGIWSQLSLHDLLSQQKLWRRAQLLTRDLQILTIRLISSSRVW